VDARPGSGPASRRRVPRALGPSSPQHSSKVSHRRAPVWDRLRSSPKALNLKLPPPRQRTRTPLPRTLAKPQHFQKKKPAPPRHHHRCRPLRRAFVYPVAWPCCAPHPTAALQRLPPLRPATRYFQGCLALRPTLGPVSRARASGDKILFV
jgi:hypothetical protein